jgi:hypothetical protein
MRHARASSARLLSLGTSGLLAIDVLVFDFVFDSLDNSDRSFTDVASFTLFATLPRIIDVAISSSPKDSF